MIEREQSQTMAKVYSVGKQKDRFVKPQKEPVDRNFLSFESFVCKGCETLNETVAESLAVRSSSATLLFSVQH